LEDIKLKTETTQFTEKSFETTQIKTVHTFDPKLVLISFQKSQPSPSIPHLCHTKSKIKTQNCKNIITLFYLLIIKV